MAEAPSTVWRIPSTPLDEAWGLFVSTIVSGEDRSGVPPGRWRLKCVVRGAGTLTAPGRRRQRVEAGDVVLSSASSGGHLVPDLDQTCRVHQVDFGGAWMERWEEAGFFGVLPRVIRAGFDESLLGLVVKLVELAKHPTPDSSRLMAGTLGHLLARLECAARTRSSVGRQDGLIQDAYRLLGDPERNRMGLETFSEDLGVSYSWFRKCFRAHTGLSPQRYRLLQQLDRACQLLGDTSLPVGTIADRLGFSSQAYFARRFRKETGFSPTVWRRQRLGGGDRAETSRAASP
ncbi:MAG: AraC family transcriptional regulator [Geothrix sp.]|nr:AraC family transcriptional regulator [Geothrix sp.]